jgi:ribonuclease VapC
VIVVDSSAVCAILFSEIDRPLFEDIISGEDCAFPVSCFVETAITWRRKGKGGDAVPGLVAALSLKLLPADAAQAQIALEADRRYGRGTRHPARLNFGDCLAYAAAVAHDAPLLFKGRDFASTDVKRAAS